MSGKERKRKRESRNKKLKTKNVKCEEIDERRKKEIGKRINKEKD